MTGNSYTGTLTINNTAIRAEIYSFSDYFDLLQSQHLFLMTELNEIVSLHKNIGVPPSLCSSIEPRQTTYKQEIISNLAIQGQTSWGVADRVRSAHFTVEHVNALLRHNEKIKLIGRTTFPTEEQLQIYREKAVGMTLRARYSSTYSALTDVRTNVRPYFEIEFHDAVAIDECIERIFHHVCFLSFCLGTNLKPKSILIDRLSNDERKTAIENGTHLGPHEVHCIWPTTDIDTNDMWIGASPVLAHDDEELATFRMCLIRAVPG